MQAEYSDSVLKWDNKTEGKIYDCLDTWSLSTELHGVTPQQTGILIPTAVSTSNRNNQPSPTQKKASL